MARIMANIPSPICAARFQPGDLTTVSFIYNAVEPIII
jgi:hypothetical protein